MNYLEWNNLIAKNFFNPENAGKEILLYVNNELIEELGQPKGCGQADFINAVKTGPEWSKRSGFCQKALQTYIHWRTKNFEYPPYIAYLACFVLAAGTEMEVRSTAYYPRLNKILGEPENAPIRSFDRVTVLWEDLEKWSKEDKHEELGRFVFGIQGSMIWVGIPKFQTLISAEERKNLKIIFAEAELDPVDPPSREVMLKRLLFYGDHLLQRKTQEVLNTLSGENFILKEKLLEFVMDELEGWDGELPLQATDTIKKSHSIQSGLRLCMELDEIAGHVKISLRLKTNRSFPEEPLKFSLPNKRILICKEASQSWSRIIKTEEGNSFNASTLSWEQGVQIEDKDYKWKAKLKGSGVKLFISGKNEGFPGWIETQRLDGGIPFKLAVNLTEIDKVVSWGKNQCSNFHQIKVTGFPEGWSLFAGHNAQQSCVGIDELTLSSSIRLSFRGGVKVRGGNTYLHIAAPYIVLENSPGKYIPIVNGQPLIRIDDESHFWRLPEDAPINELLHIEVETSGKKLKKIMRLEEPALAVDYNAPKRNSEGEILQKEDGELNTFSGAIANIQNDSSLSEQVFRIPSSRRELYFLGLPGQICEWPAEKLPDWKPEWVIEKINRNEWCVSYYRKSFESTSTIAKIKTNSQTLKKWKEIVWVKRKQHKLPDIPMVRQRWKNYVETAKNV